MICTTKEILDLVDKFNSRTAYRIMEQLKDLYNEEGKNAVIVAIENNHFNKAAAMLNPVKIDGENDYKIYFNPFANAVISGVKPLNWPEQKEKFTIGIGIFDTKENYCAHYSIYNYINSMPDSYAKKVLLKTLITPPYEYFDQIKAKDIPNALDNKGIEIYNVEDIHKYHALPFVSFVMDMFKKGITVKTEFSNSGYGKLSINILELNEDNKGFIKYLINNNLMIMEGNNAIITLKGIANIHLNEIEMKLGEIAKCFIPQIPECKKVSINNYYEKLRKVFANYEFTLPANTDEETKIRMCQIYNTKLTLDDTGKFFYVHPSDKERTKTISKEIESFKF